jgi:hypothetical protein
MKAAAYTRTPRFRGSRRQPESNPVTSGLPVIHSKPTLTARIGDYIVSTARNRVLPSATRSYAFAASANG